MFGKYYKHWQPASFYRFLFCLRFSFNCCCVDIKSIVLHHNKYCRFFLYEKHHGLCDSRIKNSDIYRSFTAF